MIGKNTVLMISALAALIVVLSGCAQKECEYDSDCPSARECFRSVCDSNNVCQQTPIQNCCGNMMCEDGENACNCAQDCKTTLTKSGKCEGIVEYTNTRGRTVDARYASYYCEDDCEVGVPQDVFEPVSLFAELGSDPKFELVSSFEKPLVTGKSVLRFTLTLSDVKNQFIIPKISVTRFQLMQGSVLFGTQDVDFLFEEIGDSFSVVVPLTGVLSSVEEEVRLEVRIDYSYDVKDRRDEGIITPTRTNYRYNLPSTVIVDPSKV